MEAGNAQSQRIDKWLWHARMFKTRSLAAKLAASGKIRVNSARIAKASHAVGPGDALTFPQGDRIRVLRIVALSARRGPFSEASQLYEDLTVDVSPKTRKVVPRSGERARGAGRPTKLEGRRIRSFTTPS